jgi:hypothetical protein
MKTPIYHKQHDKSKLPTHPTKPMVKSWGHRIAREIPSPILIIPLTITDVCRVETAINNSVNTMTKMTPTQLLFGTSIRLFPSFGSRVVDTPVPAVADFIKQINESVDIAKDNHLTAKTSQAHNANKHRRV